MNNLMQNVARDVFNLVATTRNKTRAHDAFFHFNESTQWMNASMEKLVAMVYEYCTYKANSTGRQLSDTVQFYGRDVLDGWVSVWSESQGNLRDTMVEPELEILKVARNTAMAINMEMQSQKQQHQYVQTQTAGDQQIHNRYARMAANMQNANTGYENPQTQNQQVQQPAVQEVVVQPRNVVTEGGVVLRNRHMRSPVTVTNEPAPQQTQQQPATDALTLSAPSSTRYRRRISVGGVQPEVQEAVPVQQKEPVMTTPTNVTSYGVLPLNKIMDADKVDYKNHKLNFIFAKEGKETDPRVTDFFGTLAAQPFVPVEPPKEVLDEESLKELSDATETGMPYSDMGYLTSLNDGIIAARKLAARTGNAHKGIPYAFGFYNTSVLEMYNDTTTCELAFQTSNFGRVKSDRSTASLTDFFTALKSVAGSIGKTGNTYCMLNARATKATNELLKYSLGTTVTIDSFDEDFGDLRDWMMDQYGEESARQILGEEAGNDLTGDSRVVDPSAPGFLAARKLFCLDTTENEKVREALKLTEEDEIGALVQCIPTVVTMLPMNSDEMGIVMTGNDYCVCDKQYSRMEDIDNFLDMVFRNALKKNPIGSDVLLLTQDGVIFRLRNVVDEGRIQYGLKVIRTNS